MRTKRPNLRNLAILALILFAAPAIAQSAETATNTPPLIDVAMETNYILLLMAVVQVVVIVTLGSVIKAMGGTGSLLANYLKKGRVTGSAILLFSLLGNDASAATSYAGTEVSANTIFWFLIGGNVLLFVILLSQLVILRGMVAATLSEPEAAAVAAPETSFADKLLQKLTRTVKVDEEKDILMHHEYDGIRELDNVLPPWWLWLFYGTIIWGVVYIVNVHVINVWPHQEEEYAQEMAQAKADVEAYLATVAAAVDENTATIDPTLIAQGRSIYDINCKTCHGAGGEGTVGPNLTDDHWKNGGGIKNIFKTVKYGVPERGMIAWKVQLSPVEIHAVTNYIISLHGTNPPNAKPAEGKLWMEEPKGDPDQAIPVDGEKAEENKAVAGLP
jgi:cytochrome c oxidase cbb3-type subunit III